MLTVVALLAVFVVGVKILRADGGNNMFGYMWSSNIGWIKMNDCDNPADSTTCNAKASYGVTILPVAPGTMSGYAWSSNIGWITFNSSGCPLTGCTPGAYATWKPDGSAVIHGWARACSVYATGCSGALKDDSYLGTWDGYIALDSTTAGGTGGTWGLTVGTDNKIGGYAWGSEVIGWIKSMTASLYIGGPTVTLVANPANITLGNTSVLTATASNIDGASACTMTASPSATLPALVMAGSGNAWTGKITVSPTLDTTYTVKCTKGAQTAVAQATVTVDYLINPGDGGGGSGTGGPTGGYCAGTNPQFAWNTDATECTLSRSDGVSETVAGTSQNQMIAVGQPAVAAADGYYYYTSALAVLGTNTKYTLQCNNGTAPITLNTTVNQCTNDFTLVPSLPTGIKSTSKTSISQDFVQSKDGKTLSATFNVTVNPISGFTDPVTLSVLSVPTNAPASLLSGATFSTTTLASTAGKYNTVQVTFTIPNDGKVKQGDIFQGITLEGTSTNLSHPAKVTLTVGAISKGTPPVFNEF